jgi:signal transduction histidine kinase
MKFTADELRTVTILESLPEWQLAWFSDHGEKIDLAPGDRMFERGQPSDFMFIVVRGAIQRYEEIGGQWLVVATTRQGEVTGMLPYSRMTHYPGYTVATEASQVLRITNSDFQEMLSVSQEIGRRLVAVMSDRVRGDVRLEQQRERMVALGRLSAGLAHELNNPAAAVRRAAASLSEQLAKLSPLVLGMMPHRVDKTAVQALDQLQRLARERHPTALSPLERSGREEELTAWLEDHGVANAWEIAGTCVDAGLAIDDLEELAGQVPPPVAAEALAWVASGLAADHMVAEIASSAARISELTASIKTYSHMDRSPEHKPTDVREGLDNTLTMLSHKLKKKSVQLARDYQQDLPTIPANAGELNQVWTNLIDNALDAMNDGGNLRIDVRQQDAWVAVRVIDDGHGISDEVRARIFEPFFTTKAVGEGTGLGLDIAMRIVKTHQGHIEVQSKPGRTEMCVRLPVSPAFPLDKQTGA